MAGQASKSSPGFGEDVKKRLRLRSPKAACRHVSTVGALLIRNTILTPEGRKLHGQRKLTSSQVTKGNDFIRRRSASYGGTSK